MSKMRYKVNVNECYYNVDNNENVISKIIEADNVFNLIDKIKIDNDLNEYIDEDYLGEIDNGIFNVKNKMYLLLNEVVEFECELLK